MYCPNWTIGVGVVQLAGVDKPDVVVLDLGLPDMHGVAVIERLRRWSTVPIIVLSARTDSTDKVEALDAGADDCAAGSSLSPHNPVISSRRPAWVTGSSAEPTGEESCRCE